MSNIITVGREFGSGGRELAKRLAEKLNYKYYDKEIINEMISQSNFDEKYIENIDKFGNVNFPYTISKSFSLYSAHQKQVTQVMILEQKIIKELAQKGNCVFVGRCANVILQEYKPLNIFVYANMQSKINRCKEKAQTEENLTEKQIIKKIKEIDKSRKKRSLLLGFDTWGQKESYDLCINTTEFKIKNLVSSVAEYAKAFFKENN